MNKGRTTPLNNKEYGGQGKMDKQTMVIAVETKNRVVQMIGRSLITHPKIKFKGGSIKWLDDSLFMKKSQ